MDRRRSGSGSPAESRNCQAGSKTSLSEIPCTRHSQRQHIAGAIGMDGHDVGESGNHVAVPLIRIAFLHRHRDSDGRLCAWVAIRVGAVNVVFCEARPALPPSSRKHDPHSIDNGGFPGFVLTDEHRSLTKIDGEVFDRSKVLDVEPGDAHGFG